jgi:hypothetical protein
MGHQQLGGGLAPSPTCPKFVGVCPSSSPVGKASPSRLATMGGGSKVGKPRKPSGQGPRHPRAWGAVRPARRAADLMSIKDKATYGPRGNRGRFYRRAGIPRNIPRPEEAEQAAVEEMSPGTYMPLWQLMAMGVESDAVQVKAEPLSARLSSVPTLPTLGRHGGGGGGGPMTLPRHSVSSRRQSSMVGAGGGITSRSRGTTARGGGGAAAAADRLAQRTVYDHEPPGLLPAKAGLKLLSVRTARQRLKDRQRLGIAQLGSGEHRAPPLRVEAQGWSAAEQLSVAKEVARCGVGHAHVWGVVSAALGGERTPAACHACWRRILRAWSSFELAHATRTKNLPELRKALARAAALQEETPEVAEAELQQAELESLVRDYDAGNEQDIAADALPWSVEQLVRVVRCALYKTAVGQDLYKMVSRWDDDGSGQITYEEFVEALRHEVKIPAKTVPDHYIQQLFDFIDTDRGGTIDAAELVDFLNRGSRQRLRTSSYKAVEATTAAAAAVATSSAGPGGAGTDDQPPKSATSTASTVRIPHPPLQPKSKSSKAAAKADGSEKLEGGSVHEKLSLQALLGELFSAEEIGRFSAILLEHGFESVADLQLGSSSFLEQVGLPAAAAHQLIASAKAKQQPPPPQQQHLAAAAAAVQWGGHSAAAAAAADDDDDVIGGLGDLGHEDHMATMKRIIAGLQSALRQELTHKESLLQAEAHSRLAEPLKRFRLSDPQRSGGGQGRTGRGSAAAAHDRQLHLLDEIGEEAEWLQAQTATAHYGGGGQMGLTVADKALAAAGWGEGAGEAKALYSRPLRLGWVGYSAETPRRIIILDQWRKHCVWERDSRAIVAKVLAISKCVVHSVVV